MKFPTPTDLFTIDDLGGWTAVTNKFFDPDKGIVTEIEEQRRLDQEQVTFPA